MKIAILVVALAVPASAPLAAAQQPAPARTIMPPMPEGSEIPNAFQQRPGCLPIAQQVQNEAKRFRDDEHRRLDREPPALMLFAVDRQVGGCREATIIRPGIGAPAGR